MREFYKCEWLPYAISIGIKESEFWSMTLRDLRTHEEAQHLREIREDEYAWNQGRYITIAVMAALDTAFNGKKATMKYPEKPFLTPNENNDLTQEEYEEKVMREQVAQMDAMIAKEKLLGMPEVL